VAGAEPGCGGNRVEDSEDGKAYFPSFPPPVLSSSLFSFFSWLVVYRGVDGEEIKTARAHREEFFFLFFPRCVFDIGRARDVACGWRNRGTRLENGVVFQFLISLFFLFSLALRSGWDDRGARKPKPLFSHSLSFLFSYNRAGSRRP